MEPVNDIEMDDDHDDQMMMLMLMLMLMTVITQCNAIMVGCDADIPYNPTHNRG